MEGDGGHCSAKGRGWGGGRERERDERGRRRVATSHWVVAGEGRRRDDGGWLSAARGARNRPLTLIHRRCEQGQKDALKFEMSLVV